MAGAAGTPDASATARLLRGCARDARRVADGDPAALPRLGEALGRLEEALRPAAHTSRSAVAGRWDEVGDHLAACAAAGAPPGTRRAEAAALASLLERLAGEADDLLDALRPDPGRPAQDGPGESADGPRRPGADCARR